MQEVKTSGRMCSVQDRVDRSEVFAPAKDPSPVTSLILSGFSD
jgi:hypothetical protein